MVVALFGAGLLPIVPFLFFGFVVAAIIYSGVRSIAYVASELLKELGWTRKQKQR